MDCGVFQQPLNKIVKKILNGLKIMEKVHAVAPGFKPSNYFGLFSFLVRSNNPLIIESGCAGLPGM